MFTNITHQRQHPGHLQIMSIPLHLLSPDGCTTQVGNTDNNFKRDCHCQHSNCDKQIKTSDTFLKISANFPISWVTRSSHVKYSGTNQVSVTSELKHSNENSCQRWQRARCTWRQKSPRNAYLLCRQMQLWVSCMFKCTAPFNVLISLAAPCRIALIAKYHNSLPLKHTCLGLTHHHTLSFTQ